MCSPIQPGLLPPSEATWAAAVLIPMAVAWWSAALSVVPVQGGLAFSNATYCGLDPTQPMPTLVPDADFFLRVFVSGQCSAVRRRRSLRQAPPATVNGSTTDACVTAAHECQASTQICEQQVGRERVLRSLRRVFLYGATVPAASPV